MNIIREPRENGTVLILGAGASKGSCVPEAPPTMNEFIYVGRTILPPKYDKLWVFLEKIGYPLKDLDEGKPNLEELYSKLHIISLALWQTNERELLDELGGEYWAVTPVFFLESFIIELTNKASINALRKTCKLHDALVKSLSPGDSIISFNYDLIIDASISKNSSWSEVGGYGFPCYDLGKDNSKKKIYSKPSDILLLKPHGSLNWIIEKPNRLKVRSPKNASSQYIPIKSFHEELLGLEADTLPKIKVRTLNEIGMSTFSSEITPHLQNFNEKFIEVVPESEHWKIPGIESLHKRDTFIIPPTPYKFGTSGFPEELSQVWRKMKIALQTANKIVFIGFSFSSTDVHFDTLFRLAMRNNNNEHLKIEFVDPIPAVCEKLVTSYPEIKNKLVPLHVKLDEYVERYL